MSDALEAWKQKQRDYQSLIQKAGHHDSQMRFHQQTKLQVDKEIDAVIKKTNSLESQLTAEDLDTIKNQHLKEKKNEPSQEVSGSHDDQRPMGVAQS